MFKKEQKEDDPPPFASLPIDSGLYTTGPADFVRGFFIKTTCILGHLYFKMSFSYHKTICVHIIIFGLFL